MSFKEHINTWENYCEALKFLDSEKPEQFSTEKEAGSWAN